MGKIYSNIISWLSCLLSAYFYFSPQYINRRTKTLLEGIIKMGFWSELWQNTKRVFSLKCPRCRTNDADLPSEKRIITRLVHQHSHPHSHWKRDSRGHMHMHTEIKWNIELSHKCQKCGHKWRPHKYNSPLPSFAPRDYEH
jgi:hypothetical protein